MIAMPRSTMPMPMPMPPLPAPALPQHNVYGQANTYVQQFDKDHDGSINVNSESSRTIQSWFGDDRRESIQALASAADQLGNQDGKADANELARVIELYDTGNTSLWGGTEGAGDGNLTGTEWSNFKRDFGPRDDDFPHRPHPVLRAKDVVAPAQARAVQD